MRVHNGHGRVNLVCPSRQGLQHLGRLRFTGWLSEHAIAQHYRGVRAEDDLPGGPAWGDGLHLSRCNAAGVCPGGLTGKSRLIDVGREHLVSDTDLIKQLAATGRPRGQQYRFL